MRLRHLVLTRASNVGWCLSVAVRCSLLQCVTVCCSVLQRGATCCSVSQNALYNQHGHQTWADVWSDNACCNVLQCGAVCCNVVQCVVV